jgi:uncharacterized protein
MTKEEYKKNATINHFEKLLLLKDKMNTVSGKKLPKRDTVIWKVFLQQFYAEWEGEIKEKSAILQ